MTKKEKVRFWYKAMKRYVQLTPSKKTTSLIREYAVRMLETPLKDWWDEKLYVFTPLEILTLMFADEIEQYKKLMVSIIGQDNCYKFVQNVRKQFYDATWFQPLCGKTDNETLNGIIFLKRFLPEIIDISITWSHTSEGWDYWNDLNDRMRSAMPSPHTFFVE